MCPLYSKDPKFLHKGCKDFESSLGDLAPRLNFFSCSTHLSTKFQLLINTKIPANEKVSCFTSLRFCIYHCWHFNIY